MTRNVTKWYKEYEEGFWRLAGRWEVLTMLWLDDRGHSEFWMARRRGTVAEVSVPVVRIRRDVLDVTSDLQISLD